MKRGRETESRERACLRLHICRLPASMGVPVLGGGGGARGGSGGQQVYVGAGPRGTSRGEQVRKCPWHVLHCHTGWTCCDWTAEHPVPPGTPQPTALSCGRQRTSQTFTGPVRPPEEEPLCNSVLLLHKSSQSLFFSEFNFSFHCFFFLKSNVKVSGTLFCHHRLCLLQT